jgi:hypothetical protein
MENTSSTQNPTAIDVGMILKTLDGQFVTNYITRLESCKSVLKEYLVNIADLEKRLSKVESSTVRKALGEDSLVLKKTSLEETLSKLEAHQKASLTRLRG